MADQNGTLPAVQALADVATDEDRLFRDGYVRGVSEFIKTCATPMTIAIQGDWGTGKTSLINLIDAELKEEAKPAGSDGENADEDGGEDGGEKAGGYCKEIIGVDSIDVWQQSIANPNVNLFEFLLGDLVVKLAGSDLETMENLSSFADSASQILGAMFGSTGDSKADSKDDSEDDSFLGSILGSLFAEEEEPKKDSSKSESGSGFVKAEDIEAFKNSLSDVLQQTVEELGKSQNARIVVFVDGLDHIDPQAAVNLMEQIKNYLDCPRCVFVYAVDEKTVYDGVRKKLGDKIDEGRRRMYFDKLVQVPLRIPASAYNLDKYIKDLLKDDKELSGELAEVISTLLNNPTPLGIKRYINTMYLYQSIFGDAEGAQDESLAMLLAAVILGMEGKQGFNAVASCARGDQDRFAENLEAALGSLNLNDGVKREKLPTLWSGEEGADVDAAKRDAFFSWVKKLK